ncbi:MAG TPA: hydantoinase/oxoprolinase family protein [Azospirillum sp.]|nr:hydantoinase/oxoprolinase family protein [Azospirillum sp.]
MGYTIDIDTGGTFTDGFFAHGEEFRTVKTPTTPHDLTACFLDCIRAGADAFGVPVDRLLREAEVVRFSNTIGTNAIIERTGAKVGLIVTKGCENLAPATDAEGKAPLVAPDMVLGVDGNGDSVLETAQTLIDRGAHCLVVALHGADADPAAERAVRAAIKAEYPRDYLGSVPVFLSTDVIRRSGYQERINSAVLNAYIHGKLTRLLYKAGEDLRRNGFPGQLLIGHNNGAAARVAKTRAINTYNSGPAAGLLGAREIGALYGAELVVSADMGGTSFDIGFVRAGEPSHALRPDVEGFRCNLPMLAIRALGAGGGSIASVDGGRVLVGPRSAGALPGPACFDLGGTEPTVTDANLVLGLLDPDYFLGGRKRLNAAKAAAALESRVAGPLGVSVEEAAWRVRACVDADMGLATKRLCEEVGGRDPMMVVYGGAGPLHACAVAEMAGIRRIVVTPFSAVFSAYSSSLMDVGHLYHTRVATTLRPAGDMADVAAAIDAMRGRGERDMRGEGFAPEQVHWAVELIVQSRTTGAETKLTTTPDFHRDLHALEELSRQAAAVLGGDVEDDLVITTAGLFASAPVPHFRLRPVPVAATRVEDAARGRRTVYLGPQAGRVTVPVFDRAKMGHGHALRGACIVESNQTTVYVPDGWSAAVDRFDNLVLEMGA